MKRALTIAVLVAIGCGGTRGETGASSGTVLTAYIAALEQDHSRRAYELLSSDVRKQVSFEVFEKHWRAHKRELELQAQALRNAREATPDLGARAVVRFKDGKEVSLSRQETAWRIDRALVGGAVARTPRDAVHALRIAIDSASFDRLVAVLSKRKREALVRMLKSFSKSMAANEGRHIQRLGDQRAEMFWEDKSGRYKVRLLLEDGEWRIDDFDIALREKEEDGEPGATSACGKDDPLCGL